jgi:hypothetical protein
MFKRAGAFAAIPLVLATLLTAVAASSVAARGSKVITIDEATPCHFTVAYTYSSLGGKNDQKLSIGLFRVDQFGDMVTVGVHAEPSWSPNGAGTMEFTFTDSGQSTPHTYVALGNFVNSRNSVLRKTIAWSEPTAAETCA